MAHIIIDSSDDVSGTSHHNVKFVGEESTTSINRTFKSAENIINQRDHNININKRVKRWEIDAWAECCLNLKDLSLAALYEFFPWYVGYSLCYLIEGPTCAWNHFSNGENGFHFYFYVELFGIGSTYVWIILLTYVGLRISASVNAVHDDDEFPYNVLTDLHSSDVIFILMCQLFRTLTVALRYAYYPPSEMQMVRGTRRWWGPAKRQVRSWGIAIYLNFLNTLEADMLEQLLVSGLRNSFIPMVKQIEFSSSEDILNINKSIKSNNKL